MSMFKYTYNPTLSDQVMPGWTVEAATIEAARLMIELQMERRGYWGSLKRWTTAGKQVRREEDDTKEVME